MLIQTKVVCEPEDSGPLCPESLTGFVHKITSIYSYSVSFFRICYVTDTFHKPYIETLQAT